MKKEVKEKKQEKAFSSINVIPSSFAIFTICVRANFKNTLGIFTNFLQASSVNLTSGSILSAAYITDL